MTSATTTRGRGTSVRRVPSRGSGPVLFASILLMVTGCSAVIHGIATVANSHVFAHYAAASLRTRSSTWNPSARIGFGFRICHSF